jgi:hypothetical protein
MPVDARRRRLPALGQLAEGGGNLNPLASAGAAVELAGAVLAFLALDCG